MTCIAYAGFTVFWLIGWMGIGGNQREKDRERSAKKAAANAKKPKESASSLQARKEA